MPCRDYYDDHPEAYYGVRLADKDKEIAKLQNQVSFAESALCAVLAAGDELCKDRGFNFYTKINFAEACITSAELAAWHKNHLELDAKHRAEELLKKQKAEKQLQELERRNRIRADAMSKLTAEEKKVLGIK